MKVKTYHNRSIELAQLATNISHPAKLMILEILSKHKDRTCKELVYDLPLSQASVSQHLKALLKAHLICRTFKGTSSLYCIEWNQIERMFHLIEKMKDRTMKNRPKRNCC